MTEAGKLRLALIQILNPLGMEARVEDNGNEIFIEPNTKKIGKLKAGSLDGMQIIYFKKEKIFEVSEYMAGKKEDELWIYETTKTLKGAITGLLKGNNRKPTRKY